MTHLTLSQKLWLAKRLPERIIIRWEDIKRSNESKAFMWKHDLRDVTSREWHYIVSLVEGQLDPMKQADYATALKREYIWKPENEYFNEEGNEFPLNEFGEFALLSMSIDKRTTALQSILKD